MGVYFTSAPASDSDQAQIQIEDGGAPRFHQRGVQLEEAAHGLAAPEQIGRARGVLERARFGGRRPARRASGTRRRA